MRTARSRPFKAPDGLYEMWADAVGRVLVSTTADRVDAATAAAETARLQQRPRAPALKLS